VANSTKESRLEIGLRSKLHRAGYRFRKQAPFHLTTRTVRVDMLFPHARLAVFVDGCYWHLCPQHAGVPRDRSYWLDKLRRNAERDREVSSALQAAGWTVLRLWEHLGVAECVRQVVGGLRQGCSDHQCPMKACNRPADLCSPEMPKEGMELRSLSKWTSETSTGG